MIQTNIVYSNKYNIIYSNKKNKKNCFANSSNAVGLDWQKQELEGLKIKDRLENHINEMVADNSRKPLDIVVGDLVSEDNNNNNNNNNTSVIEEVQASEVVSARSVDTNHNQKKDNKEDTMFPDSHELAIRAGADETEKFLMWIAPY